MPASKFVNKLFKGIPGFLTAFCLTQIDGIAEDFHNQMMCGLLFLAQVFQTGEPLFSVETSAAENPSRFSTATCGYGAKMFPISTPPTNLNVSSLYP